MISKFFHSEKISLARSDFYIVLTSSKGLQNQCHEAFSFAHTHTHIHANTKSQICVVGIPVLLKYQLLCIRVLWGNRTKAVDKLNIETRLGAKQYLSPEWCIKKPFRDTSAARWLSNGINLSTYTSKMSTSPKFLCILQYHWYACTPKVSQILQGLGLNYFQLANLWQFAWLNLTGSMFNMFSVNPWVYLSNMWRN